MKYNYNRLDIDKVRNEYFRVLTEMGENIPSWLYDAKLMELNEISNAFAYADPENNTVYYSSKASQHTVWHELEHLRSRHNEPIDGVDEIGNVVKFYFVGFRQSGFEGMFLEEGFNELSTRKMYLRAVSNNEQLRKMAVTEYKSNKYYNFEMYNCLALCSLLGINVEFLRKMKYSGDLSAQEYISGVVYEMSGRANYWRYMQEFLDSYEMCKRMYASRSMITEIQNESMAQFYRNAYNLLFFALSNKKISKEDFKRRLKLFNIYSQKSMLELPDMRRSVQIEKNRMIELHKHTLKRNRLYAYAKDLNVESFVKGDSVVKDVSEEFVPFNVKLFAEFLSQKFHSCQKQEVVIPENVELNYGLV